MEVKVKAHSIWSNMLYAFRPVVKNKPKYMLHLILEAALFVLLPLAASAANSFVIALLGNELTLPCIMVIIMTIFIIYGGIHFLYTYFKESNHMAFMDMRITYHWGSFMRKCMDSSLEQFESNAVRTQMSKAEMGIDNNSVGIEGLMRGIQTLGANLLGLAVYALIVGGLDPKILLLLLTLSIISTTVSFLSEKVYDRIKSGLAMQNRMQQYIDKTVDDVPGGKDIRIFGLSPWLIGKYDRSIRTARKLRFSHDTALFTSDLIETVLNALRTLLCYLYLIAELQNGMSVTQFVFYLGLISGFAAWFSEISRLVASLKENSRQIDDLRSFVEMENDLKDKGEVPVQGFDGLEIVFDHVSYRYENAPNDVLKDVSFTIKPGEHLALVGLNGAGKSTIVKLASGLYLPSKGSIYVNGVDTRKLNRPAFMEHCAAIFQNPFLLSYTIGENITFSETYDSEKVRYALKQASILETVEHLPKGIYTYLGKDVNRDGVGLSGGQAQRLLLARALYRNPSLLLLDEPTAALDAIAENEIYEAYNTSLQNKTVLFISHRLASTRFCDNIILLENGKICEQGTHEELMRKNGSYASLFSIQSKYYKEET